MFYRKQWNRLLRKIVGEIASFLFLRLQHCREVYDSVINAVCWLSRNCRVDWANIDSDWQLSAFSGAYLYTLSSYDLNTNDLMTHYISCITVVCLLRRQILIVHVLFIWARDGQMATVSVKYMKWWLEPVNIVFVHLLFSVLSCGIVVNLVPVLMLVLVAEYPC